MARVNVLQSHYTWSEKIVLKVMQGFKSGHMRLELPSGQILELGNGGHPRCDMTINNPKFFTQVILFGDIGFGEAYQDGLWDTSSIKDVISFFIANNESFGEISGGNKGLKSNWFEKVNRVRHLLNNNRPGQARKNISFHYDLSNEFYSHILDPSMTYSCGLFENAKDRDLAAAQKRKYQTLADDCEIKSGESVLEIGLGWGGMMEHILENHDDMTYHGLTLSERQLEYALQRKQKIDAQKTAKAQAALQDYRHHRSLYQRIVSIEMMEAIGKEHMKSFFKSVGQCLKPGGLFTAQVITSPDSRFEEMAKGVDWIQKHIFPGSLLPSLTHMLNAAKDQAGLHMVKFRDIGPQYAQTLDLWNENLNNKWEEIKPLGMDERFKRTWNYYFEYCSAAFSSRNISVVQMTLSRPNNQSWGRRS